MGQNVVLFFSNLMYSNQPYEAIMPKEKIAQTSRLVNLPLELLMHIFSYILESSVGAKNEKEKWPTKIKEVGTLAQTCRRFYQILEPQLNLQAKQLLLHVLQGDAANAEKMFTINPELLFIEATAPEYAAGIDEAGNAVHRIVRASPYRAALGAGDKDLLTKMEVHFDKVGNFGTTHNPQGKTGWEMAKVQFYEQFPNGIVDYPESAYYAKFNALAAAITEDLVLRQTQDYIPAIVKNPSETTKALLVQLRNDFLPKEAVTSGHHFNLNHLLKAFEVYNAHWDEWNWNQRSLFWCQVIGYVERLVPAVDAQAFCMGLYYLLEQKQPLARGFKLENWGVNGADFYFPASGGAGGLGFDFGIYIALARGHGAVELRLRPVDCGAMRFIEQLCRAKTSGLDSFKQHLEQPAHRQEQRQGRTARQCVIL